MSMYKKRVSLPELSNGFIRDTLATPDFPVNKKLPSVILNNLAHLQTPQVTRPLNKYKTPRSLPQSTKARNSYQPINFFTPKYEPKLNFKRRRDDKLPPLMPMVHIVKRKSLSERLMVRDKLYDPRVGSLASIDKL